MAGETSKDEEEKSAPGRGNPRHGALRAQELGAEGESGRRGFRRGFAGQVRAQGLRRGFETLSREQCKAIKGF